MNVHSEKSGATFPAIVLNVCLALTIVWSVTVPSLVVLLASRGFSTGMVSVDESPSNVIRWFSACLFAFGGGVFFMWITTTALSLVYGILLEFSRDDWKLRSAFEATTQILIVVDFCCATFVGGFAPEILSHFGFAFGSAVCSTHLGAALLFISAFIAAFSLGAILLAALVCVFIAGAFVFGLSRLISLAMKSCR